jgi:oligoribonuclease NrnB/cAMP/cGMP phosphodiesterase (DHH superfamily)
VTSNTNTTVFYHDDHDGIASAWAAMRNLGITADYIAVQYGSPVWLEADLIADRDVVFLDFAPPPADVTTMLAARPRTILILDHHKTARDQYAQAESPTFPPGNVTTVFDLDRAGCQIAWDYFNPGTLRPTLLEYVADRDLWRFGLQDSRAISAWLNTQEIPHPSSFGALVDTLATSYDACRIVGTVLLAERDRMTSTIVDKLVTLHDRRGYAFGCRNVTGLISDVGAEYLRRNPDSHYCVTYFDKVDQTGAVTRVYSLRSRGDFDVAELATQHGGGGHKAAAGFTCRDQESVLTKLY